MQHVDLRGNVWDCGIGNNEPHYKDIEYYGFTYMIPKYKIQPPDDFCEYYQTHKDEIIIELDKKTKEQKEEIERLTERYNNLKKEHIDTITRNEDYRARIDKAIELINDIFKDNNWYINYEFNDLQNKLEDIREILQGSDKE